MNYAAVHRWLVEHTSLEPSLLQGAGFETVIAERLACTETGESAYVATLEHSSEEVDRLTAGIAVPETWLFRYPQSFQLLVDFMRRRRSRGASSLRLCSIGCATGQEPYCIAMAALHAGWPAAQVSLIGLDRNRDFLRAAAIAEYGPASIRGEIPPWAVPFLTRRDAQVGIDPAVRAMVRFTHADATDPAVLRGLGPLDAVFCRNVMIYLHAQARTRLLDSICAALAADGLLFVGHAEQVLRGAMPLRPAAVPHTFALERCESPAPPPDPPRPARRAARQASAPADPMPAIAPRRAAAPAPALARGQDSALNLDDARDLADAGRTHESESMVRSVLSRQGPSAAALELLGTLRMAADDLTGARRLFEQAVYLEPARSTSLLHLAMISERSGDPTRAALLWERARRASGPADPEPQP